MKSKDRRRRVSIKTSDSFAPLTGGAPKYPFCILLKVPRRRKFPPTRRIRSICPAAGGTRLHSASSVLHTPNRRRRMPNGSNFDEVNILQTLLVNARRSFFHPPRGGCTRGMFLILLGCKHGALDHCFECFGINQQSLLWLCLPLVGGACTTFPDAGTALTAPRRHGA